MRKVLRILLFILLGLIAITVIGAIVMVVKWNEESKANMRLLGPEAPTITIAGYSFRDLNKNGELDTYEDARADITARVDDLVSQMTLEEKAGSMFITMIGMNPDGGLHEKPMLSEPMSFFIKSNSHLVAKLKMNHFNVVQSTTAAAMADWAHNLQKLGERTRLGIPITIASDPRHVATENIGAGIPTPFFSRWCSPLGFGAIRDSVVMREFGEIARQEYRAIGITVALSPMADLATEPRWTRVNGTFGEDAELSAMLTSAYIRGFQGDSITERSVACMAKHFPGAGPQKDGEDAHFPYGKDQAYPGGQFDYHLIPFEKGVFPNHPPYIMPYYGVAVGQTSEDVGFAFNNEIITGMLREKYEYEGVVCTDWMVVTENPFKPVSAYGAEGLSPAERVKRIIDAGCDMFGGESVPELIIENVQAGLLSEERIDESVKRIMLQKFKLGLFDDPFPKKEDLQVIGNRSFVEKGLEAQRKSLVLLKNENDILPLSEHSKVYVHGIEKEAAIEFANVVPKPEYADVVVIKLQTPFDPRSEYMLERFFPQGRLNYNEEELNEVLSLTTEKPVISIMTLNRPTIFPEINAASDAVIADFECDDEALFDLIFGRFNPSGKLPIELPSSAEAVEEQMEDMPYDSRNPLYKFGHGLSFN